MGLVQLCGSWMAQFMGLYGGLAGVARFWWVCDLISGGKGSDL